MIRLIRRRNGRTSFKVEGADESVVRSRGGGGLSASRARSAKRRDGRRGTRPEANEERLPQTSP